MIRVYRGINVTKKEVYHGVSKELNARKDGSHCIGGTKALRHRNCENDKIIWKEISVHRKQEIASSKAHKLENDYKHHKGFKNIKTKGI